MRRVQGVFMGIVLLSAVCASPFAMARSTPVNVVNFPEVQAVEDIDNPAFQPAQMGASQSSDIGGLTLLVTGAYTDEVPPGKRLVVQHVSFDLNSVDLEGDPVCRVVVRQRDPFQEFIAHRVPTEREYDGARERAVASLPMTLYADAGQQVGVTCSVRVSGDTNLSVAVTGYYIDVRP
ncbi:MAG: hypothetical protein KDI68_09680 [Gammaproteobacteria bacterium]|nr:hypothetical protein [Gammaproteobacteria bacterium]